MGRRGSPSGSQIDPEEHDRIDELMAGYALRSLSGEDATEADRLLSQHVPDCARCRETLLALSDTVADLAFAADPIAPPETLLPRLHRELEPRERPPLGRWAGVAAGVAVVLVTGGLAVSQVLRATDLEDRNALFAQALRYSQRPGADSSPLVGGRCVGPGPRLGGRRARRRSFLPRRHGRARRLRPGSPTGSGSPTAWTPSSRGPSFPAPASRSSRSRSTDRGSTVS